MGDYRPKIEQRIAHELLQIGLLLCIALIQMTLAPSLWYFRIDWVLVFVLCMALVRGFSAGLRWALYGGLALDLLSSLPLGSYLLGLVIAVVVVAVITDGFPRDNRLVPTVAVLFVALLYSVTIGLLMSAVGQPIAWGRYPLTIMVPTALADGIVTLPIYLVLRRLTRGPQPAIGFDL